MVFDEMHLETRVSEKVPMTTVATLGGFLASRVCMKEVRALFLATGPAMPFLFGAAMTSLMVIGFPTMGTDVTGPEKPRQLGDDVIMVLVVQQDQLFVLRGSKGRDVKRSMGIHQQDLVTSEGRGLTKRRQGVVTTGAEGYVGFPLQVPSQGSLQGTLSLPNGFVFRVLVHASFGDHKGSSTTEFIPVLNPNDGVFLGR